LSKVCDPERNRAKQRLKLLFGHKAYFSGTCHQLALVGHRRSIVLVTVASLVVILILVVYAAAISLLVGGLKIRVF
jgi:hypothetical protein